MNPKTVIRLGMLKLKGGVYADGVIFDEWIPAGYRLVSANGDSHSPLAPDETIGSRNTMAIAERAHRFYFRQSENGRYRLARPIDVYEHLGRGDGYSTVERDLAGSFTLIKPNDCGNDVRGRLRMEMLEGYKLRLKAFIGGRWIELQRI
jgi:hypothetical protein